MRLCKRVCPIGTTGWVSSPNGAQKVEKHFSKGEREGQWYPLGGSIPIPSNYSVYETEAEAINRKPNNVRMTQFHKDFKPSSIKKDGYTHAELTHKDDIE